MLKDKGISNKFKRIALMGKGHADFWSSFLKRRDVHIKELRVNELLMIFKVLIHRVLDLTLTIKLMKVGKRRP